MGVSEAARADLYHGLVEVFGTDRAETLMAALPGYDFSELATTSDIALLGARIDGLEAGLGARMDGVEAGLGARMDGVEAGLGARMDALETRMTAIEASVLGLGEKMDGVLFTLVAGLFVIVVAMVGVFVSVQAM